MTDEIERALPIAMENFKKYTIFAIFAYAALALMGYFLIKILLPKYTVITSWFRSLADVERLTGGKLKFDWHVLGLVWDITGPENKVTREMFEGAKKIFPVVIAERGNTITTLREADHLHVGWINKRMGVQVL